MQRHAQSIEGKLASVDQAAYSTTDLEKYDSHRDADAYTGLCNHNPAVIGVLLGCPGCKSNCVRCLLLVQLLV